MASAGATDTRQHMSQLLERFFTPRSAKAVEKALGAMTQQLAQEEEAQGHRLSPGLAALQRGECQCVDAEANVHTHHMGGFPPCPSKSMHYVRDHCWYLGFCNRLWCSSQRVHILQQCTKLKCISDKVQTTAVHNSFRGTLGFCHRAHDLTEPTIVLNASLLRSGFDQCV